MLIDVHCHLTGEEYEGVGGVESVIARAQKDGVERIVCSGFDLESSIRAQELAHTYSCVYFCAGLHPSELLKHREGDLQKLKTLCQDGKCVAVGEIGLDYHFDDNPPKQMQREFFIEQLRLADELGLPIVLHSRDAAADTLEILQANKHLLKRSGLMHCYSYSPEMVNDFLALGLYFSFGGPSTFKNAKKVWESVQRIPATRILTETDCPYLTPVPLRGEFPNQPQNVKYVAKQLAQLRGEEQESFENQVIKNAKTLFFKLK